MGQINMENTGKQEKKLDKWVAGIIGKDADRKQQQEKTFREFKQLYRQRIQEEAKVNELKQLESLNVGDQKGTRKKPEEDSSTESFFTRFLGEGDEEKSEIEETLEVQESLHERIKQRKRKRKSYSGEEEKQTENGKRNHEKSDKREKKKKGASREKRIRRGEEREVESEEDDDSPPRPGSSSNKAVKRVRKTKEIN